MVNVTRSIIKGFRIEKYGFCKSKYLIYVHNEKEGYI